MPYFAIFKLRFTTDFPIVIFPMELFLQSKIPLAITVCRIKYIFKNIVLGFLHHFVTICTHEPIKKQASQK